MTDIASARPESDRRGSLLSVGFATSVLMWATAYAALAPGSLVPVWLLVGVLGAYLLVAGFLAGRLTGGGAAGALNLGLALTAINFIIVASLNGRDTTGDALKSGLMWIGGFALVSIGLCLLGGLAAGFKASSPRSIAWTSMFSLVVAITTLPLIVSGGIVTGLEAGMAVPDWLTTFDYPMMFYPLVKMQESEHVYAEHFHRLWGLLVGLSVISLLVHVHLVETRTWVKRLSIIVLLAVIIQGILGGTRVTENNLPLAIVHGVFGQAVFATIVCMAAFCSRTWTSDRAAASGEGASIDIRLTTALPFLFIIQLVLGALYRHLNTELGVQEMSAFGLLGAHILLACILTVLVVVLGMRALGFYGHMPRLPRLGLSLLIMVGVQVLLGVAAMIAVLYRGGQGEIPRLEVVITTFHQTAGAILLALSALMMIWTRRLVTDTPQLEDGGAMV